MESEQLQNFNERLSQWVANQGFWFQVRYSMSGSGMKGQALFHLLRLTFRLLVFLLLVALGTWIYLVKRTDSESFRDGMRQQLQAGLSATDLEMKGANRQQGQLEVNRIAAEGDAKTFFSQFEARNVRCNMGLLDGLMGVWEPGIVSISRLDIDLRAGADDAESAAKLSEALFRKSEVVDLNALEVASASLRWGYTERTYGAIEGSELKMQRTETGWRMNFRGGTFRQNWLKGLEIVNMVVVCEKGGLVFEKAELKRGEGTVDFSGLRLIGGERPEVKGVAKIRKITLESIMPAALRSFVEGVISGDFRVFGSTNTSEGIGFEGQVVLDGEDVITLRERIHILKALSVVDYSRNYRRIDFREGSMLMKTTGGGMELTEVDLKADDLFTLEGNMKVRLPTSEEVQAAVARGAVIGSSPLFASEDAAAETTESAKRESDFSLKKAAEAQRIRDGAQDIETLSLFDRLGLSMEMRRLETQASERMSRMLRYEGAFRITIPGDAFERARLLEELYPVNPATKRIAMRVPLEGNLYELTLKQAEDLYEQGQR